MEDLLLTEDKFSPWERDFPNTPQCCLSILVHKPQEWCQIIQASLGKTWEEPVLGNQLNTQRDTTSAQASGLERQQSCAEEQPQTFCSVLAKDPHPAAQADPYSHSRSLFFWSRVMPAQSK